MKKFFLILSSICSIPYIVIVLLIIARFTIYRDIEVEGDSSPSGEYRVYALISDRGFGPGADYHTDIEVRNEDGIVILRWDDPDGQSSDDESRRLLDSVTWIDSDTVKFNTELRGVVTLNIIE